VNYFHLEKYLCVTFIRKEGMEILIKLSFLISFMAAYIVSFSILLNINNPNYDVNEKSFDKFIRIKNNNAFRIIPLLIAFAVSVYLTNLISVIIFN
tara:strand:- start:329 stop:616 length:288 start_codon:yes stop_codon:yes gene_type:complete